MLLKLSNNSLSLNKGNRDRKGPDHNGHSTVMCSVTWPLNASEAEVDFALRQTCLFLIQMPTN